MLTGFEMVTDGGMHGFDHLVALQWNAQAPFDEAFLGACNGHGARDALQQPVHSMGGQTTRRF